VQELALTQQQNAELRVGAAQLSSRLEEEGEVVAALRAQLVEYKLLYGQMQLQAKKGRTLHTTSSSMFRGGNRPGSATPPGQLQLQGAGSAGYAGGGVAGVLAMQGLAAGAAAADGGGIGILNRSASFLNAQLLQGMSPGAAGVVADGPGGRGHQPQHR
jgi:hypothetical protein